MKREPYPNARTYDEFMANSRYWAAKADRLVPWMKGLAIASGFFALVALVAGIASILTS